jgi:hypothetical protein
MTALPGPGPDGPLTMIFFERTDQGNASELMRGSDYKSGTHCEFLSVSNQAVPQQALTSEICNAAFLCELGCILL